MLCDRVRGRERSSETSGQSIFLPCLSLPRPLLSRPIDDIIFYTHSHRNNPKSIPEQHKPRAIHHSEPHNLPNHPNMLPAAARPVGNTGTSGPYNTGILLMASRTADRMEYSANGLSAKSQPIRVRDGTLRWVGDIDHGYMWSVSEKGVRAPAPSSVKMCRYGGNCTSRLDRR